MAFGGPHESRAETDGSAPRSAPVPQLTNLPEGDTAIDGVSEKPWNVLVLGRTNLRRACIDQVMSRCNARPWRIEGIASDEFVGSCCRVLLVELEAHLGQRESLLATIQALKQKGYSLVAFGDGVESWPLRDRCRLLLAGVSYLLDSSHRQFGDELRHLLTELLVAEAGQQAEERRIKDTMAGLGVVGVSQAMITVFRSVLRISVLSDLPTLLVGETGTGKELLAHAIHALDPKRRKGPFIALNCAALAPSLAESELFGHRRGAFTGAERNRPGLIRAAQDGVLFLDEIGELDLSMQAKLLRVLQESRVLSIGDEHEVPISVRMVAATNRDLEELVKQRRFRADLFHRLKVISLHTPALRDRPDDVGPLARSFVAKCAGLGREGRLTIAPEFIEALTQAELPGNVRQLENIIRQALVNKRDTDISLTLSDLPVEILQQLCEQKVVSGTMLDRRSVGAEIQPPASSELRSGNEQQWEELLEAYKGNLARCLAFCERALVAVALRRTQGNQSQTARLLGITPRSVYNKLHKHQLQP